ncbi:MAG: 2OG-Fe(II) oxygenase [Crocinitomicaceae bacterium]
MEEKYEEMIQMLLKGTFGSVDNWFSVEELDGLRKSLIGRYEENAFRPAKIGNQFTATKEESIRSDQIHWLFQEDLVSEELVFFQRIEGFKNYLNRTCFAGIQSYEFHYAMYFKDTFYKRHSDQFNNDDRRQYSMVLYLNEDWQMGDGGELMLYTEPQQRIAPTNGKLVFFQSDIEHEVLLSAKTRLSLTGWFKSV